MEAPPKTLNLVYRPDVFEVQNIDQAKSIIVTRETGTTTEERWQKETPFLVEDIGRFIPLTPDTTIIDYGCGIGRVAKGLIEMYGCRVVGVDFSKNMRLLAPEYVLSDRFLIWSPETLAQMVGKGFRANAAICLWVIQHVLKPDEVIAAIRNAIVPGGLLYALNQPTRCVPTNVGWVNDKYDIRAGLAAAFKEEHFHRLPETATVPVIAATSMIQVLRKPT